MIQIRPVSDLRNKFSEIEKIVSSGQPVFLTKNGYGTMVVMDLERYSMMEGNIEEILDESDKYAAENAARLSHNEVFDSIRRKLSEKV